MQIWSLSGFTPFEAVRELQLILVELRHLERIPDTLLFLEHEPIVTRGRGLQYTGQPRPKQMPLLQPLSGGIGFSECERGGDLTYHGPGQWVMYPICKLDGSGFAPHHDIAAFLRKLERVFIDELACYGLKAGTKENASGVWIGAKKIASVGIAVRKWVTYHGVAMNCVNDLKPFHLISPCGFNPDVMTRLSDWVELDARWRDTLENSMAIRMFRTHQIRRISLNEAKRIAESYLAPRVDSITPYEWLGRS